MSEKILLVLGASSDLGVAFIDSEIEKNYYIIAHYNKNTKKKIIIQKKYK